MGLIYYKQRVAGTLTFFIVNPVTRNIEKMFREIKTKNTFSLVKDIDTKIWKDIDHNILAKSLIENSIMISQEEYEAAEFVLNAMVESDYWMLSEDSFSLEENNEKKVVTDVVYC